MHIDIAFHPVRERSQRNLGNQSPQPQHNIQIGILLVMTYRLLAKKNNVLMPV